MILFEAAYALRSTGEDFLLLPQDVSMLIHKDLSDIERSRSLCRE